MFIWTDDYSVKPLRSEEIEAIKLTAPTAIAWLVWLIYAMWMIN